MSNNQCYNEKALLVAVLRRGILDACGIVGTSVGDEAHRGIIREARRWLTTWDLSDEQIPMSFPWVCLMLDMSAERVMNTAKKFFFNPPLEALKDRGYANSIKYADMLFSDVSTYGDEIGMVGTWF